MVYVAADTVREVFHGGITEPKRTGNIQYISNSTHIFPLGYIWEDRCQNRKQFNSAWKFVPIVSLRCTDSTNELRKTLFPGISSACSVIVPLTMKSGRRNIAILQYKRRCVNTRRIWCTFDIYLPHCETFNLQLVENKREWRSYQ